MPTPLYKANDQYVTMLRKAWIHDPAEASLQVYALPDNFPTLITLSKGETEEAVFAATGCSGNTPSEYVLTGVTWVRGYEFDQPLDASVSCLNNEEYINQYAYYFGINWKGEWDDTVAYVVQDGVSYNNESYVCIQAGTNHLPTDTDYWQIVGIEGAKGDRGDTGSVSAASDITLTEIATPANPAASSLKVYAKSDDKVYTLTSGGTEKEIGGGADILQVQIFN